MSLTFSHGPLAEHPSPGNYRIDGPEHRLFLDPFPRRVRAVLAGHTVLDTRHGRLLHETGLLPQLYVPRSDVRTELLAPSRHTTHCPYKGKARYWTLSAGGRTRTDAAWEYADPIESAGWLRDQLAFYWNALDSWYDEDEVVEGHLRDPYCRVDVRPSSCDVRVRASDTLIAATKRPRVLSETGLPNRFYVPLEDVHRELLVPSTTHTVCPYKGRASYYDILVGARRIPDAAWYYPEPLDGVIGIRDHLCFLADGICTEVDGVRI